MKKIKNAILANFQKTVAVTSMTLLSSSLAHSQVSVNNTDPKATFDITASNSSGASTNTDGILIPRVSRERAQNMATVETSTLIYVNNISTGSATGKAANINAVGFYSFDGSVWQKFGNGTEYTGTSPVIVNNVTDNISVSNATSTTNGVIRLSGDLNYNDATSPRVTGLQNIPVSPATPSNEYVLTYNSTTSRWEPRIVQLPVVTPTFSTVSGGASLTRGPYNKTAYVSCTTTANWDMIAMYVNGQFIGRTEGMDGYKSSQSTIVPRGATWLSGTNYGCTCVVMQF